MSNGMPNAMLMGEVELWLKDVSGCLTLRVDACLPLPSGLLVKNRDGEMEFFPDHRISRWKFISQAILSERAKRN